MDTMKHRLNIVLIILLIASVGFNAFLYLKLRSKEAKITSLQKVQEVNGPLEEQLVNSQFYIDSLIGVNETIQNHLSDIQRLDPEAPGVFFEVQMGIFKQFSLNNYRDYLIELRQVDSAEHHFILLGRFDQLSAAEDFVQELKKLGFRSCFVVGRINGRITSVKEAISQLDQATF